ncbi:MAG: hypothetical protein WA709_04500, partial [Stellaceae bacterium]
GKQHKPYRQETGVGTRAVNPDRADPRWARQRRAWRHLVSAAKLPMVCLGVNRISMLSSIGLVSLYVIVLEEIQMYYTKRELLTLWAATSY